MFYKKTPELEARASLTLGQKVSSKLFKYLSINFAILLCVLLLISHHHQTSTITESRGLLISNLAAAIEPIAQRFDLYDIHNILKSLASASQIHALELVDFYGRRSSSDPDITTLGMADAQVEILGTLGETGYILVWWGSPSESKLFVYLIIATILFQFIASSILGWYGLNHYINKLITTPLTDLQSHIIKFGLRQSTNTRKDHDARELNDVYDTFYDVQKRLNVEHQEQENALLTIASKERAGRTLISDISYVMSSANRAIKYYPSRLSEDAVHIGYKVPLELHEFLSRSNITLSELSTRGKQKQWKIKLVGNKHTVSPSSKAFNVEVQLADGRFWSVVAVPTSDTGSAYLCMDVSAQKAAEQQERNTQHFESLGVLTSGVAHNFSNILAIIMAAIESDRLNIKDPAKSEYVLNAISRGKILVSQLLESSRGMDRQIIEVNLNEVFNSLKQFFNANNLPNVNFRFELLEIKNVVAEKGLIESTISNLIMNSCQAMNMYGHVIIRAQRTQNSELSELSLDKNRKYVTIEVIDEGPGVTGSIIDQLFDPFFTTKSQIQGSGLGLSMARGFAQRSGGEVFYRRGEEQGAIFGIILPAGATEPSNNMSTEKFNNICLKGQRIILVDDEPALLDILSEIMRHLDLEVIQATNCTSACAAIEQSDFDWIISDMYMPHGNGLDVLEHCYKFQPKAKRILMSGNIRYSDLAPEQKHLVGEILQKPFSLQSLKVLLQKLASA